MLELTRDITGRSLSDFDETFTDDTTLRAIENRRILAANTQAFSRY
jgi:hypothetical protein